MKKKAKFTCDVMLNIISVAIPLAVLQLVIYPLSAQRLDGDEYGLMLTIYSVWMLVSETMGYVLNNVKLLRYPQYEEENIEGDFPIMVRNWDIVNAVVSCIIIMAYCGSINLQHGLLGLVIAAIITLRTYVEVGFRITLDYMSMVIKNVVLALGFFAGFGLFCLTGVWELIFLLGYGFSCIFCVVKTGLLKEKPVKTKYYKTVSREAYSLMAARLISNLIGYADRLLVYPLMGGMAVSIYYTATVLGKIVTTATSATENVILSYVTKWDKSKANYFYKLILVATGLAAVGYFATVLVSRPIIGFLFPQWVDQVMVYVPVTTVAIMIGVISSTLTPFVMKFCNLKWQIAINGIGAGMYFLAAIVLWWFFGLMGFCWGTVIGAAVKLAVLIIVYYRVNKKSFQE